jgi:hypothetical protein
MLFQVFIEVSLSHTQGLDVVVGLFIRVVDIVKICYKAFECVLWICVSVHCRHMHRLHFFHQPTSLDVISVITFLALNLRFFNILLFLYVLNARLHTVKANYLLAYIAMFVIYYWQNERLNWLALVGSLYAWSLRRVDFFSGNCASCRGA